MSLNKETRKICITLVINYSLVKHALLCSRNELSSTVLDLHINQIFLTLIGFIVNSFSELYSIHLFSNTNLISVYNLDALFFIIFKCCLQLIS